MPDDDAETLLDIAERALDFGDRGGALGIYLRAARGYAAQGAIDAALDACQRALALAPGTAPIHVEMIRLYLASGWRDQAAEKLSLLDRMLALDGREPEREELRTLAAEHSLDALSA